MLLRVGNNCSCSLSELSNRQSDNNSTMFAIYHHYNILMHTIVGALSAKIVMNHCQASKTAFRSRCARLDIRTERLARPVRARAARAKCSLAGLTKP